MSDIIKYEILNPVSDVTKPFIRKDIFYIPLKKCYNYYIEAAVTNELGGRDYYILLGTNKFNPHCRRCSTDGYGRVKIKLQGDIKDYVYTICERNGNIDVVYTESTENYDAFELVE